MKRVDPAKKPQKQVKRSRCTGSPVHVTWHTPVLRSRTTKKNGWSAIICGYSTRVRVRAVIPDSSRKRCVQSTGNAEFSVRFLQSYLTPWLPPNPPRSPPGKPSAPPSRCTGLYHLKDTMSSRWIVYQSQTPTVVLIVVVLEVLPNHVIIPDFESFIHRGTNNNRRLQQILYDSGSIFTSWQFWPAHLVPVTMVTSELCGGYCAAVRPRCCIISRLHVYVCPPVMAERSAPVVKMLFIPNSCRVFLRSTFCSTLKLVGFEM